MREIKFRVRYRDVWCFIELSKGLTEPGYEMYMECVAKGERFYEYTGLHDKNGKEIYEGDIVSLESWNPKEMQVVFTEGAFCLGNKHGEYIGDIHYVQHGGKNQATIIGNIYENKNLLSLTNQGAG